MVSRSCRVHSHEKKEPPSKFLVDPNTLASWALCTFRGLIFRLMLQHLFWFLFFGVWTNALNTNFLFLNWGKLESICSWPSSFSASQPFHNVAILYRTTIIPSRTRISPPPKISIQLTWSCFFPAFTAKSTRKFYFKHIYLTFYNINSILHTSIARSWQL